jgi:hypothetical protein
MTMGVRTLRTFGLNTETFPIALSIGIFMKRPKKCAKCAAPSFGH